VLALIGAFNRQLTELEEMAAVVGWAPHRRMRVVTVPSVRGTLAAAALLGFLVSWAQYGTSLAVGGGLPTLPIVLPFVNADPEVAAALGLVFLIPAVAALGLAIRGGRPGL